MQHNELPKQGSEDLSNVANPVHGPQGVDKAPGEETPQDNVQFLQQTQKGKTVDADLTEEKGRPIQQDEDL